MHANLEHARNILQINFCSFSKILLCWQIDRWTHHTSNLFSYTVHFWNTPYTTQSVKPSLQWWLACTYMISSHVVTAINRFSFSTLRIHVVQLTGGLLSFHPNHVTIAQVVTTISSALYAHCRMMYMNIIIHFIIHSTK